MDLVEVHDDLQALRKLYGLLQYNTNGFQELRNETLDERAKLLLKHLLDGALEKALQTRSKITAAEQFNTFQKLASPVSANTIKSSPHLVRSPKKDPSNCYQFKSKKDELSTKPISKNITATPSKVGISSNKSRHKKKFCRGCEQRGMMQQSSIKEPIKDGFVNEKSAELLRGNPGIWSKGMNELQDNSSVVNSVAASSSNSVKLHLGCNSSGQKSERAPIDFSKGIDNAVRRIESSISDLQLLSDDMVNANSNSVNSIAIVPPREAKKIVKNSKSSFDNHAVLLINCEPIQLAAGQISKKPGSSSEATGFSSQIDGNRPSQSLKHVCVRHGLIVQHPPSNGAVAKKPPIPLRVASQTSQKQTHEMETIRKRRPHGSTTHVAARHRKKPPPRQLIARPTLLEAEYKKGGAELGIHRGLKNKVVRRQIESESESESDTSVSSSNLTTPQTSTDDNDSNSDSDIQAKSLPKRLTYGESEISSDSQTSNSSSWTSHSRTGKYRSHHQANKASPKDRKIGRLRRFKNKLGLIFHHHHHHHHHHHRYDDLDDRDVADHSKVRLTESSMWKLLQNILHTKHKHRKEFGGKGEVGDKLRNSRKSIMIHKHHTNHFHTLVKGLTRHVRQSKKSKPSSKGGIRELQNAPKKKLRWWVTIKRHGRVKLGNRRVRFNLKTKRLQLR